MVPEKETKLLVPHSCRVKSRGPIATGSIDPDANVHTCQTK